MVRIPLTKFSQSRSRFATVLLPSSSSLWTNQKYTAQPHIRHHSRHRLFQTKQHKSSELATATADSVVGGDFAGITIKLTEKGQLLPLPDLWVPESLREWGQVPDYVEIIVSEDCVDGLDAVSSTTRNTLTILPETGCAIDNLDVVKSSETMEQIASFPGNNDDDGSRVECLVSEKRNNLWFIETVFQHCDDFSAEDVVLHRIRLGLFLEASVVGEEKSRGTIWNLVQSNSFSLPTLQIAWEARFNKVSSSGSVADGGGLDGQRVHRWMGPIIPKHANSFATTKANDVEPSKTAADADKMIGPLQLPGNLTLSFGLESTNQDPDISDKTIKLSIRHKQREIHWSFVGSQSPSNATITLSP